MANVPKSKREKTDFQTEHDLYALRDEITELVLQDFGFSAERYLKEIERYRKMHEHSEKCEEVVARKKKRLDSFLKWFVDKEADTVLDMLRDLQMEFSMGNSIHPSDTPARIAEYCQRRKHMNEAIGKCHALEQELNYIARTMPVDKNKYERLTGLVKHQEAMIKGVRKADNRFIKSDGEQKYCTKNKKDNKKESKKETDNNNRRNVPAPEGTK